MSHPQNDPPLLSVSSPASPHRWQFFRTGGFDQVRIESAEDLRHLRELDQKLWAVLTVPTSGLEFDTRTLELLDSGSEGRIRAPELLAAVDWVCQVLCDPGIIFAAGDELPLAALNEADAQGAQLAATAREVLAHIGRPQADAVSLADLSDPARLFAPQHFNGDGIVPVEVAQAAGQAQAAEVIGLVMASLGGLADRSGQPGIDAERLDTFMTDARAVVDWCAQVDEGSQSRGAVLPLGEATADAVNAFDAVRAKVEDYFTRCRLAAFDGRAAEVLNPGEPVFAELAPATLKGDDAGIAALPLARVAAGANLPLVQGLNPAWEAAVAQFRERLVRPLLGDLTTLSAEQWGALAVRLEPWRQWQAARPASAVAALEPAQLRAALDTGVADPLRALIARDLEASVAAAQVQALEKLLRLRRDLATLLRNFVNLADFYGGKTPAIFQAGTLYLDQRSCELCLHVADMTRHAALAPLSGIYLVYCQCTRPGEAPMTIVAAMTGGDADDMMVPGRNGVFYDRQGRDWHASVVKIVANPISVRQAFWTPYKRVARMVGDQIQKFAAARDKDAEGKADAALTKAATQAAREAQAPPVSAGTAGAAAAPGATGAPGAPVKAPAPAFDIAKFAGVFAAIGLAFGALGTALAAILSGFLALPLWKMPLVIAGLMLLISGPSMILAWLKLRKRNLGPLLDANGWAVNIRARLNIPFGASLTGVAALPEGARHSLSDPFADKPVPWGRWALAGLLLLVLAVWSWFSGRGG